MKGREVFGSQADCLGRGTTPGAKAKSTHGGVLALLVRQMAAYTAAGVKGSQGRCEACGIGQHWIAIEAKATPLVVRPLL